MARLIGSNQYRTRTAEDVGSTDIDLVHQATLSDSRLRCGEVWGTNCQTWVEPPEYTHARHGLNSQLARRVANPRCSAQGLDLISQRSSEYSLLDLLLHPNCPVTVLRRLVDRAGTSSYWVARHPNCPSDLLEQLGAHEDATVRYAVAIHPSTPPRVLVQLAMDPSPDVRIRVLRNPQLPEQYRLLAQLIL